jgi:hypothetical protein
VDTTNKSGRLAASLVALGSLIWPHLFLLALAIARHAPLAPRHRGWLLCALSVLGKFMLTVAFKVVLLIGLYHMTLDVAALGAWDDVEPVVDRACVSACASSSILPPNLNSTADCALLCQLLAEVVTVGARGPASGSNGGFAFTLRALDGMVAFCIAVLAAIALTALPMPAAATRRTKGLLSASTAASTADETAGTERRAEPYPVSGALAQHTEPMLPRLAQTDATSHGTAQHHHQPPQQTCAHAADDGPPLVGTGRVGTSQVSFGTTQVSFGTTTTCEPPPRAPKDSGRGRGAAERVHTLLGCAELVVLLALPCAPLFRRNLSGSLPQTLLLLEPRATVDRR